MRGRDVRLVEPVRDSRIGLAGRTQLEDPPADGIRQASWPAQLHDQLQDAVGALGAPYAAV